MEKAREFQKNIYFCFVDYEKTFDCVDQNKLWEILKEMGTLQADSLLLRHRGSPQTSIGTMKWKYKSIEKKGAMSNFSMLKKYMAIHF